MTPTEQAARWLADVPASVDGSGVWIEYDDAIAALARHLAPGDDLVERLQAADEKARDVYGMDIPLLREAAARLSAITAQVEGQSQMMEAAMGDMIDRGAVLALLTPAANAKNGLWAKRMRKLHDQVAALPAAPAEDVRAGALKEAQPLNIIGVDEGSGDETTVAVIKPHKGGFMEVIDVKHGEEAADILRALESAAMGDLLP